MKYLFDSGTKKAILFSLPFPRSICNLIFCRLDKSTLSRVMIHQISSFCMYQYIGYLHKSPSEMDNELTSNREDLFYPRTASLLIILPNNNHLFVHVQHPGVFAHHPSPHQINSGSHALSRRRFSSACYSLSPADLPRKNFSTPNNNNNGNHGLN